MSIRWTLSDPGPSRSATNLSSPCMTRFPYLSSASIKKCRSSPTWQSSSPSPLTVDMLASAVASCTDTRNGLPAECSPFKVREMRYCPAMVGV
eukprot:754575-Hanusia_phi.AAC.4